jgi:hypothetical protein
MATVILRPDSIESSTGFDVSGATLLGRINDSDPDTGATQSQTTANITGAFDNSEDYSGATITQVQMTVQASTSGRAEECTITCDLLDGEGEILQRDIHSFTAENESRVGTAVTSGLNSSGIDDLQFTLSASSDGCIIKEVSIEVTFTVATPAGNPAYILLNSGKYKITAGKVKIL